MISNYPFVHSDMAKIVKEFGFDNKCLGYYNVDLSLSITKDYFNPDNRNSLFPLPIETNNPKISAPLYQEVLDWFEEKYQINLSVKFINTTLNRYWIFEIIFMKKERPIWADQLGLGYETKLDALNQGIKYVFEIIHKNEY